MEISVTLTKNPKPLPEDENKLGFGEKFSDHMFLMNYTAGKGWHDARILPYGPLSLDPAAMCLHYGQEVFEGMKAYRADDGRILLFRPDENFKRLNNSNDRLEIPPIDVDFCIEAVKKLVSVDKKWVPHIDGASLYIRPYIIATEPKLGVHASHEYLFVILASPSGPYYKSGLKPVKIYVETKYVRAVRGGTGFAKTAGNYACGLKAQEVANREGYSQVLWLDGVEQKYIEEVGAMNVFFVIGDEIVTPGLYGSILPGITRKSSLELLRSWGLNATERRLSIDELIEAYKAGRVSEVFGTGTAAVISPVGELKVGDLIMTFNNGEIGKISQRLYDAMTGIQRGRLKDEFGWTVEVK